MCKKEDKEEDHLPAILDCTVSFNEFAPTGKFMNSTFTIVDGIVEESSFDPSQYRFQLYGRTMSGDKCDIMNVDKPDSSIIFSIPKIEGVHTLGFGNDAYSVTFNEVIEGRTNAVVSICGAVEITNISRSTVSINIQANAQDGEENYLNGKCTVKLCK